MTMFSDCGKYYIIHHVRCEERQLSDHKDIWNSVAGQAQIIALDLNPTRI
jgi:hypothetical protein